MLISNQNKESLVSVDELIAVNHNDLAEPEFPRIVSAISHDLRTPVAVIKSNIQLLQIDGLQDSLRQECLSMCDDAVEELAKFLDIVQFINLTAKNKISPTITKFRTRMVVSKLVRDLRKLNLYHRGIKIVWDLEDEEIITDLSFIRQILFHLLSNALKFSDEVVKLEIAAKKSRLSITVFDSGIGIPQMETEKIFVPFFRASNSKNICGTGLGLSTVKAIANSLGGQIFLSSKEGRGTIIRIIIPYEPTI